MGLELFETNFFFFSNKTSTKSIQNQFRLVFGTFFNFSCVFLSHFAKDKRIFHVVSWQNKGLLLHFFLLKMHQIAGEKTRIKHIYCAIYIGPSRRVTDNRNRVLWPQKKKKREASWLVGSKGKSK